MNNINNDLISRQQAIDAFYQYPNINWTTLDVMEKINELPSVQLETNCSEIPNNSDTISRQAVTKFLNDWLSCLFENCHKQSASDLKMIIKDFKNLPSAQPELNTWNDGTLYISVSKGQLDKIGRVLVEENEGIFCKQFY